MSNATANAANSAASHTFVATRFVRRLLPPRGDMFFLLWLRCLDENDDDVSLLDCCILWRWLPPPPLLLLLLFVGDILRVTLRRVWCKSVVDVASLHRLWSSERCCWAAILLLFDVLPMAVSSSAVACSSLAKSSEDDEVVGDEEDGIFLFGSAALELIAGY